VTRAVRTGRDAAEAAAQARALLTDKRGALLEEALLHSCREWWDATVREARSRALLNVAAKMLLFLKASRVLRRWRRAAARWQP
jgi:hypothetical protein